MSSKSSAGEAEWNSLVTETFLAAPDKYEPLPLSNQPATVYGSILSFLGCCEFSVDMALKLTDLTDRSLGCSHLTIMGTIEACQGSRMGRLACLHSSGTFMLLLLSTLHGY